MPSTVTGSKCSGERRKVIVSSLVFSRFSWNKFSADQLETWSTASCALLCCPSVLFLTKWCRPRTSTSQRETRSGNSSYCIGRTHILVSTLFSSTTRACVKGRTGPFEYLRCSRLGVLVTSETDCPVLFPTPSSLS